jgi:N-dimethylarginine dimethylaminohydrolase
MKLTHHSEYGKLKSIYIKPPEAAFVSDDNLSSQWKEHNFLSKPDFNKALSEYKTFEELLNTSGATINHFSKDDTVSIDSIYCRDASIATDYGVILCNMGKEARKNEPHAQEEIYKANQVKILGEIKYPGTLEGGDVAWVDEHTLAVGHTYRTNWEGIRQLKHFVEPHAIHVWVAEMPHYKGPSDVFHLMSVFSPVDKDLAVVYSPLMPISFRNALLEHGLKFVEVPDSEWDSMGCNVLAIAPREVIMVKGNPITKQRLLDAGCSVHEYDGQEISVKGGGGPTCLTRPIERFV